MVWIVCGKVYCDLKFELIRELGGDLHFHT